MALAGFLNQLKDLVRCLSVKFLRWPRDPEHTWLTWEASLLVDVKLT